MRFPPRLREGDEIRVLALSRSLGGVMQPGGFTEDDVRFAVGGLESLGLTVTFGACVRECNEHLTAPPRRRLDDLHEALVSPSVKAILAVSGGIGAIQLLDGLDFALASAHPKILCGYSDVAYVSNAICARADVATYYGPNFTTFMMRRGGDFTLSSFRRCLFETDPLALEPARQWSDDAWHRDQAHRAFLPNDGYWCVQEGEAEGTIVGGNRECTTMMQGTGHFPPLQDAILFLEQPAEGKATLMSLDSALRALSLQRNFGGVRGIVLGRYARSGGVSRERLRALLREIPGVRRLPVLAHCDFGHTSPMTTLPIGGVCRLRVSDEGSTLVVTRH